MRHLTIGIVDYEVGNLASIQYALNALEYRCLVSTKAEALKQANLLLLPGVGAFPYAMKNLRRNGLDQFICEQATQGKLIVGFLRSFYIRNEYMQEKYW